VYQPHLDTPAKIATDVASFTSFGAVLAGFLPVAASFLTVLWLAIRIYETDTVQKIFHKK